MYHSRRLYIIFFTFFRSNYFHIYYYYTNRYCYDHHRDTVTKKTEKKGSGQSHFKAISLFSNTCASFFSVCIVCSVNVIFSWILYVDQSISLTKTDKHHRRPTLFNFEWRFFIVDANVDGRISLSRFSYLFVCVCMYIWCWHPKLSSSSNNDWLRNVIELTKFLILLLWLLKRKMMFYGMVKLVATCIQQKSTDWLTDWHWYWIKWSVCVIAFWNAGKKGWNHNYFIFLNFSMMWFVSFCELQFIIII